MLARHVKHLARFASLQNLVQRVELLRLGEVSQVTGMQHEGRGVGERIDLGDCLAQCGSHVLICLFVEADMAVADLNEAEIRAGGHAGGIGIVAEGL